MKNIAGILLAFVASALPAVSHAASFDCAKAASFVEKAICSNATLSRLDDALSENYSSMRAANIGDGARKHLQASQKKWLAERNRCADEKCVASAYRKRIDEICEYPVVSGVHPGCISPDEPLSR